MNRSPKEEVTDLLGAVLPLAEKMLKDHGEFFPYGGAMLPDGSMTHIAATDGSEHPPPKALIELLEGSFRTGARLGKFKATAIVYDVRIIPPGATEKTDAIAVRLDHVDSYSVEVMYPYRLADDRSLIVGTTFALPGKGTIFPHK